MSNLKETLEQMKNNFDADEAADLDAVFQFNLEDGDNFHIIIKDAAANIEQGDADEADCTLIMSTDTLTEIMSGEKDGMQAFMMGELKVEGDIMLSTRLGELFPAA
jgi:putative sterol carrier protein